MTTQEPLPAEVFTREDRLLLLQLLTRRAIGERRERVRGSKGVADTAGSLVSTQDPQPAAIPDRWQLIPEDVSLYDWQRECLPLWLTQGRGTVKVATGGGKTLFALAAAQALQNQQEPDLRLVIVVPTIPLMWQWYDEILRGNIPSSAIALMGGGQELPPPSNIRILVCVLNSARDRLPDLARRTNWSRRMLLVVDECHRTGADQAKKIFEARPQYTLGLSATPEPGLEDSELPADEAYEHGVVGQALGPIIYDFNLRQSLAAGLLTPFEVWHVGLPLTDSEAMEHGRLSREITELRKTLQIQYRRSRSKQSFLAWCQTQASRGGGASMDAGRFIGLANRRKRLLFSASARIEASLGILSEALVDQDSRGIVFHESIEHIEDLFLLAIGRGLPAALEHSELPDSLRGEEINAFRQGVARVIISARSLIEGFNVPSADLGIIAASSSSVRQRIQSLGRMLRRKPGDRTARIVVLYMSDTEDEAIYEKADWEEVIGAERNRYFTWRPGPEGEKWPDGLEETMSSPRAYRPPASEVDASMLSLGDPYPGQTHGLDLKVDQADNLRTDDEAPIPARRDLVEAILRYNPFRRARLTPAGHLIVRTSEERSGEVDWRFLGVIDNVPGPPSAPAIRLKLQSTRGRRVIAREGTGHRGIVHFALGPGSSRTSEAGEARDQLLRWVEQQESQRGRTIRDLYWDGDAHYWLEVEGTRIEHEQLLAPLEFAQ